MAKVILPTSELLSFLTTFQELFSFYEDGLRGLVRDCVLLSDSVTQYDRLSIREFSPAQIDPDFAKKVMREYEESPSAMFLRMTENTNSYHAAEMALEYIHDAVVDMVKSTFGPAVFDISKGWHHWHCNDLVIEVVFLDYADQENDSCFPFANRTGTGELLPTFPVHTPRRWS